MIISDGNHPNFVCKKLTLFSQIRVIDNEIIECIQAV